MMRKILCAFLPLVTAAAGMLAGSWVSGGGGSGVSLPGAGTTRPVLTAKPVASPARTATAVGDQPTELEAVREEEARGLWQSGGLEPALEALKAYALANPARALALAMTLEGTDAWELVMQLVQSLPVEAGGIAMDVLLQHPQYCKACPPLDAVFYLCARGDLERAWREALAPGAAFTAQALDAIARAGGETHPRQTMELTSRLAGTPHSAKFTRAVLRGWAEADAQDLVAWLGTQPNAADFSLQVPWGAMRFESQADFLAMVRLAPQGVLEGTLGQPYFFGTAAEDGWATRLDWLQAVTDPASRRAVFTGAARALLHADPEKALALLPEVEDPVVRQQITSATAAYRAAASPEQGLAYAASLTDETARERAMQSVLGTWAENDPAAAARYALESGLAREGSFVVVRQQLGRRWAELDPQGAVSHALAHEPQNFMQAAPDTVLSAAMRQWVGQDPYAASRWVSALPAGTPRDQAVASLVHASIQTEPDGALAWAASIADPALRQLTTQNCFATWLQADQERAARWLQQAALEDATRQILETAVRSTATASKPVARPRWTTDESLIVIY